MLLCFPGELTDRFLLWLREPPMATAEMLFWNYSGCFVTETLFVPSQVSPLHSLAHHQNPPTALCCCSSNTCPHWHIQPLLCSLMLEDPEGEVPLLSPLLLSRLSTLMSLSLSLPAQLEIKQAVPSKEECVGVSVCVWRTCVTVSWGYLAGVRVLFKCERAPSFVGQLNSRSQMEGEG